MSVAKKTRLIRSLEMQKPLTIFARALFYRFFGCTVKCFCNKNVKLLWLLKREWLGLIRIMKLHTENNHIFLLYNPDVQYLMCSILVKLALFTVWVPLYKLSQNRFYPNVVILSWKSERWLKIYSVAGKEENRGYYKTA